MHYFKWNIGDQSSLTGHLSHLERSMFVLLMCLYAKTESPLSADINVLKRWARATTEDEIKVLEGILSDPMLFTLHTDESGKDYYIIPYMSECVNESNNYSKAQSEKAHKRWELEEQKTKNKKQDTQLSRTDNEKNTQPSITNNLNTQLSGTSKNNTQSSIIDSEIIELDCDERDNATAMPTTTHYPLTINQEPEETIVLRSEVLTDSEIQDLNDNATSKKKCLEIYNEWLLVMGKNKRNQLTKTREISIKKALKKNDFKYLIFAIRGCRLSDFHMGKDPGAARAYNDLPTIFKDSMIDTHAGRYIEYSDGCRTQDKSELSNQGDLGAVNYARAMV